MRLYGAIGPRVDGDYFAHELASLDRGDFDMIHIRMNSPGGNVFLVCADPARGVIGKYLGFDFYKRSKVAKVATDGTLKPWSAANAATDCAAGLAWHEDCVSRALGDSLLFDDPGNPLYYGDIISFLQRAGGKSIRADKAGVVLIRQAAAE